MFRVKAKNIYFSISGAGCHPPLGGMNSQQHSVFFPIDFSPLHTERMRITTPCSTYAHTWQRHMLVRLKPQQQQCAVLRLVWAWSETEACTLFPSSEFKARRALVTFAFQCVMRTTAVRALSHPIPCRRPLNTSSRMDLQNGRAIACFLGNTGIFFLPQRRSYVEGTVDESHSCFDLLTNIDF